MQLLALATVGLVYYFLARPVSGRALPSGHANTTAPTPTDNNKLDTRNPSHTGIATWFTLDGLEVACGGWYAERDFLVALPFWRREHCGKMVRIESRGVVRWARAVDSCPSCAHYQLDLTTPLFQQFASLDIGVIDIHWQMVG